VLRDEDRKVLATLGGQSAAQIIKAGQVAVANMIFNFAGLVFRKPGTYTFHVNWNGEEKAQVPLYIELKSEVTGGSESTG
jgi:hypothetical protein